MTQQAEQVETVFARHVQAVMARDLQAMMADYSDDVVNFTLRGQSRARQHWKLTSETSCCPS